MFDVIECFQSASPAKQVRLIVFQTPSAETAQTQADRLWQTNTQSGPGGSTFVVVDRSTARELYRVPKR